MSVLETDRTTHNQREEEEEEEEEEEVNLLKKCRIKGSLLSTVGMVSILQAIAVISFRDSVAITAESSFVEVEPPLTVEGATAFRNDRKGDEQTEARHSASDSRPHMSCAAGLGCMSELEDEGSTWIRCLIFKDSSSQSTHINASATVSGL